MNSQSVPWHNRSNEASLSVLFDLRPAFDGLYGIAQETRLSFALLQRMRGLELSGLIQHPALPLARAMSERARAEQNPLSAEDIFRLSRFVARLSPRSGRSAAFRNLCAVLLSFLEVQIGRAFGSSVSLQYFEPREFAHFLWSRLFALTLSPDEFRQCMLAQFATLSPPWQVMHASTFVPLPRQYAKVDTADYDVLIAQTPWPGRAHARTQLVVRFHDTVPIFMPHTLKQPRLAQRLQASTLRANATSAIFACPSVSSRASLLKLFPQLDDRSFVVYDRISPAYLPTWPARENIVSIIQSRAVGGRSSPEGQAYLLSQADPRFFLMVGTIEPRKNHENVIAAWQALRVEMGASTPALVLVGSRGWQNESVQRAIGRAEQRGPVFSLETVSPLEMRQLYSAAEAVVCPSFEEGFDLPSVEAIRCSGAVVASDIPVHREILHDAAMFFDPYSVEDILSVLKRVVERDTQLELRALAAVQASRFDDSVVLDQWDRVLEVCRARKRGRPL